MRTLELLQSITESELHIVAQELSEGKRETLLKLFKELKKYRGKENEPDRALLFEKVFEKNYTKSNDYLLRNELRLLNDVIYDFIILKTFKEQIKTNKSLFNLWLAKGFYARKTPLFDTDIDGLIKYADEHYRMEEAAALCWLKTHRTAESYVKKGGKYLHDLIAELQAYEKRRYLYAQRNSEFSEAYFLQPKNSDELAAFGTDVDKTSEGMMAVDFRLIEETDWYARYLKLKKSFYQSTGNAQLKYAKELYEISRKKIALQVLGPIVHIKAAETIVFCLFKLGKFQEGEFYVKEIFSLCKKYRVPLSQNHIINFIVILFELRKYKDITEAFMTYSEIIKGASTYPTAVLLSSYSYLFLNKPDEALKQVPPLTGLQPNELTAARFIYLIAFALRGQNDLALTEARNLKRLLLKSVPSKTVKYDLEILGFAYSYIKALTKPKEEAEKLIARLQKKLALKRELTERWVSVPYFLWILERIKA
jgi:hypothetical protein